MALRPIGGPITVTATARNLTQGLALAERLFLPTLVIRADVGNAGTVWVGTSTVTTTTNQLGYVKAGESLSINLAGLYFNTDDLYLVGTLNDKVYLLGVG